MWNLLVYLLKAEEYFLDKACANVTLRKSQIRLSTNFTDILARYVKNEKEKFIYIYPF